jgi:hypothetical protein
MNGVPTSFVAKHEGNPAEQAGELDVLPRDGCQQRRVGASHRGNGGDQTTLVVAKTREDLLGKEVVDLLVEPQRAQLSEGRPAAHPVELGTRHVPQGRESRQLLGRERQVALV